jgi:hypothetical protein
MMSTKVVVDDVASKVGATWKVRFFALAMN